MAGAEAAVQVLCVEKPEVPERLLKGSKFLKWPKSDGDDSIIAVPITLRVDPKGYLIYWQEPNKDTESLDISSIRDTRYGKYAKEPKLVMYVSIFYDDDGFAYLWKCQAPNTELVIDVSNLKFPLLMLPEPIQPDRVERVVATDPSLGKMLNSSVPMSDRCFTIVSGVNLVDLTFLNFIAVESNPLDVVKEWAEYIFKVAYHPTTRHISVQTSIEKAFTKLKIETNQSGEIPVKKLFKLLGGKSKRIENAFSSVVLTVAGKKTIDPEEFQLPVFKKLLQLCCQRQEMDDVFAELGRGGRRMYVSHTKVQEFINSVQRDPKLNEILYPYMTEDQAQDLISNHEPNLMFAQKGQMTQEGFDSYLQSNHNLVVNIDNYAEHQDMGLSLSNYFINSSHNTYLTGTQYRSKSTAEMYRQVLLTGCRCVELDCWEGDDEPYINHGFTFCTAVSFVEVIEAINESAFKTSPYPVVLSFENHVDNPQQQAKMAQYCRDIFKEKLLIEPLEAYTLEQGKMLPPPKELLYKIIVKNKKQHLTKHAPPANIDNAQSKDRQQRDSTQSDAPLISSPQNDQVGAQRKSSAGSVSSQNSPPLPVPEDVKQKEDRDPPQKQDDGSDVKSESVSETVDDVTDEKARLLPVNEKTETTEKKQRRDENGNEPKKDGELADGDATQEAKPTKEEDDDEEDEFEGIMTNSDFQKNAADCGTAMRESKAYEAMSSLVNYIEPIRFKRFEFSEKRNRSYEISSFTESAALRLLTFFPLEFVRYNRRQTSRIYPKGARVDSSNYMPQVFWNAGCQFVALNFQMLDAPMQLNLGLFEYNGSTGYLVKPEHMRKKDRMFDPFAKNMDGVVASTLTIRIISGQFLSSQKLSTYVEVDMYGLPNDTVRKQFKTKTISDNSVNPYYNSPDFSFKKIVLPSLAVLRIAVSDTSGNLVAQRFLKVDGLKPGYRYITLRNEGNQPITMASLFIYLQVKDFVPEVHKDLADWLANPIPYLKEKEREEKEREAREKAIKVLLGPEERKEVFGETTDDKKSDDGSPAPLQPKPDEPLKKEPRRISDPTPPSLAPVSPTSKPPPPSEMIRRKQSEQANSIAALMESFEPQTLNDIKLGKAYMKLEKDFERNLTKLREKHAKSFSNRRRKLFSDSRGTSVFSAFKTLTKKKSIGDTNTNLTPLQSLDAKKEELITILKEQFKIERDHQYGEIPGFIQKFDSIVRQHQKVELERLTEKAKMEQDNVQKRKDEEKEQKLKHLPTSLSKEELEAKKKSITQSHIDACVRDRRTLTEKQMEREESTKCQQEEILNNLEKEKKDKLQRVENEYKENVKNVLDIYEAKTRELDRSGSSSSITSDNGTTTDGHVEVFRFLNEDSSGSDIDTPM